MIPSASHPWSPWRPVTALGWLVVVAVWCVGLLCFAEFAGWKRHQSYQCGLRWSSAKSIGDSVRVAGDCGKGPARGKE